jgi:hypothetical protein
MWMCMLACLCVSVNVWMWLCACVRMQRFSTYHPVRVCAIPWFIPCMYLHASIHIVRTCKYTNMYTHISCVWHCVYVCGLDNSFSMLIETISLCHIHTHTYACIHTHIYIYIYICSPEHKVNVDRKEHGLHTCICVHTQIKHTNTCTLMYLSTVVVFVAQHWLERVPRPPETLTNQSFAYLAYLCRDLFACVHVCICLCAW